MLDTKSKEIMPILVKSVLSYSNTIAIYVYDMISKQPVVEIIPTDGGSDTAIHYLYLIAYFNPYIFSIQQRDDNSFFMRLPISNQHKERYGFTEDELIVHINLMDPNYTMDLDDLKSLLHLACSQTIKMYQHVTNYMTVEITMLDVKNKDFVTCFVGTQEVIQGVSGDYSLVDLPIGILTKHLRRYKRPLVEVLDEIHGSFLGRVVTIDEVSLKPGFILGNIDEFINLPLFGSFTNYRRVWQGLRELLINGVEYSDLEEA